MAIEELKKKNIINGDVQVIFESLYKKDINIDDLSPEKRKHVDAVNKYINRYENAVCEFKSETEIKFLIKLIEDAFNEYHKSPYQYIYKLNRKYFTNELLDVYLYQILLKSQEDQKAIINAKFKNESNYSDSLEVKMAIEKSVDEHVLIKFVYTPYLGSQITYYDTDLKMPLNLIFKSYLTYRITDSIAFINKLDIDFKHIGYNEIYNFILTFTKKIMRDCITETIIDNKLGYYSFSSKISPIENLFISRANSVLADYGICVNAIDIKELSFQETNITKIVTNQILSERIKNISNDARIEYEKASLDLFERKAEILSKHPELVDSLTKAEKDNAFRRYGLKEGLQFIDDEKQKIKTSILSEEERLNDDAMKLQKNNEEPPKNEDDDDGFFQILRIIGFVITVIAVIIGFIVSTYNPNLLLLSGISIILFALILNWELKYNEKKKEKIEKMNEELEEMEEYINA